MKDTELFDAIAHIDEDLVDRCLAGDEAAAIRAAVDELPDDVTGWLFRNLQYNLHVFVFYIFFL